MDADGFDPADGACRRDADAVVARAAEAHAAAVGDDGFGGEGRGTPVARQGQQERLLEAQRVGCQHGDVHGQRILSEAVVAAQEEVEVVPCQRVVVADGHLGRLPPRRRVRICGDRQPRRDATAAAYGRKQRSEKRRTPPGEAAACRSALCGPPAESPRFARPGLAVRSGRPVRYGGGVVRCALSAFRGKSHPRTSVFTLCRARIAAFAAVILAAIFVAVAFAAGLAAVGFAAAVFGPGAFAPVVFAVVFTPGAAFGLPARRAVAAVVVAVAVVASVPVAAAALAGRVVVSVAAVVTVAIGSVAGCRVAVAAAVVAALLRAGILRGGICRTLRLFAAGLFIAFAAARPLIRTRSAGLTLAAAVFALTAPCVLFPGLVRGAAVLLRSLRFGRPLLRGPLAAVAVAAAALAALGLVEARDAVLLGTVGRLLGRRTDVIGVLQLLDAHALAVQRHDLLHAPYGERREVRHRLLRRGEGHRPGENVALDEEPLAVGRLQRFAQPREFLAGVDVGVVFVHHAALELRALPGELLRVERDILHAGRTRRDAREARHPRRAAQLASAGAQSADASGLLAGADLLHLDADVEALGEDLDQLAEVDALVGDVVEDRLDLVALVLDVADLHVEPHVGGDLPRGDHRLVLEGDGLLPAFDVVGLGLAVDLPVFAVVGVEARAAHLPRHQVARHRDDADVVSGRGLHGDDVADLQRQVVDVLVERAPRVLEAHLHDVGGFVDGVALEPRRLVELEASVAGPGLDLVAALAEGAAAADFGFATGMVVLSFVIHRGIICVKIRKNFQFTAYNRRTLRRMRRISSSAAIERPNEKPRKSPEGPMPSVKPNRYPTGRFSSQ